MNKQMRFATFAVPLSGNKGSVSMFLGLRDVFQKAGTPVSFDVFSYYPERDKKLSPEFPDVHIHPGHPLDLFFGFLPAILLNKVLPSLVSEKWRKAIEAVQKADAVLLMGGTTFADSMLHKVPWNALAALPGIWLGAKIIFLSQTIGPLDQPLNRMAAERVIKHASGIQGRGKRSASAVRRLGINRVSYQPDLSFSMKIPLYTEIVNQNPAIANLDRFLGQHPGKKPIAFAPNSIVFQKSKKRNLDYIGCMAACIEDVGRRDFLPVLIPHSYRDLKTGLHNNDRQICMEIIKRLDNRVAFHYLDADLDARTLRAILGQMHLNVVSRFHAMVSSLATGVPPITIGWGDYKYEEVLAEFQMEKFYLPCDQFSLERFKPLFEEACKDRTALINLINQGLRDVRQNSDNIVKEIGCFLQGDDRT